MKSNTLRTRVGVVLALVAFLLLCGIAAAQNEKVKGVINGRSGTTMTVQTQNSGNVTVLLMPSTQVLEPEGIFRKKHLLMTALVPGLQVEVQGSYNERNQLVADKVTFHGSDLKTAEDIQAGLAPTQQKLRHVLERVQSMLDEHTMIEAGTSRIRVADFAGAAGQSSPRFARTSS